MNMVNNGRKIVMALLVIILIIDITTTASVTWIYAASGKMDLAPYKFLQGIFRFIFTGLLMFFLYKGHRWAKWLSVVLFGVGGLVLLVSLFSSFNLILLIMGLVYAFFCISLIVSGSVDNFLRYQRGLFSPTLREDTDSVNTHK